MTRRALKILICEDDRDVAESLADILAIYGHSVDITAFAEEAIEKAKRGNFDIAFLDILLPGMDGVECFSRIKASGSIERIHLMTGYASTELVNRAAQEGAGKILRKPMRPEDVLACLPG
jgi:DNA-binding response OmpR family regulator